MTLQLTGNTILITGGTSGIGRALAEQFHTRGNQVIVAGRRRQLLDEVEAANPGIRGLQLDVEDAAAIDSFVTQIRSEVPELNVLINNAGISRPQNITGMQSTIAVSRSIIQTNVMAVLQLTEALLPTLKNQPSATIMATTSGLAFVPFASYPTYCATKAFLHSWLQSLRFQLRNTNVSVLELAPPYVQTDLAGPHQSTDPHAVPLADFIAEVMLLLDGPNPKNGEIVVERSKELRFAEQSGNYDDVFNANNNR